MPMEFGLMAFLLMFSRLWWKMLIPIVQFSALRRRELTFPDKKSAQSARGMHHFIYKPLTGRQELFNSKLVIMSLTLRRATWYWYHDDDFSLRLFSTPYVHNEVKMLERIVFRTGFSVDQKLLSEEISASRKTKGKQVYRRVNFFP